MILLPQALHLKQLVLGDLMAAVIFVLTNWLMVWITRRPGLNFSVGSIVGPTELDIDNIELLPGASSALYGSGGMNGTLLITSKSPFKYQGLSVQFKQGVNHINDPLRGAAPYYDVCYAIW